MHKRFEKAGEKLVEKETELRMKMMKDGILLAERSRSALAKIKKVEAVYRMLDDCPTFSYDINLSGITINIHAAQYVAKLLILFKFEGMKIERKQDFPHYNNIDFVGELEGTQVRLSVWLGDSNVCQRVQTGTEEVPVYEIQCEDGTPLDKILEDDDDE